MRILNPLLMNDWSIKKFLAAAFAVQAVLWVLVALGAAGLEIPVLRPAVALVFLAYLPGAVILRILKLHGISGIEALLYSVGLSLAFIMFTGAITNAIYPYFGISRPISLMPLMLSFTALISMLSVIAYARDRNFSAPAFVDVKGILSPPVLFLLTLPLISILGTQEIRFYNSNVLPMALIVMIAITVLLIGFNKFIPENLYPLAVFSIALSLLFFRTLISQYIAGGDTTEEYYVANLVITAGHWDPANPLLINGMLSISMLAPTVSFVSNLDLTWVIKAVYPFLFAFAPLGLYEVFRKQADPKIAFFGCFFFMAVKSFYHVEAHSPRHHIGILYFILLILLTVAKNADTAKRAFLFIVFGASLIVSRYLLSYTYMSYIIFASLALPLADHAKIREIWAWFRGKIDGGYETNSAIERPYPSIDRGPISFVFVGLFVTLTLAWYLYTTSSALFRAPLSLATRIVNYFISGDFLSSETAEGVRMLTKVPTPGLLYSVGDIIFYVNQVLIVAGVFIMLWRFRKLNFERVYVAFAIWSLATLIISLPQKSAIFSIGRTYRLALPFLTPALVLGFLGALDMAKRFAGALTRKSIRRWSMPAFAVLSIYLVVYFFYQSGFVLEVIDAPWREPLLGRVWQEKNATGEARAGMRGFIIPEQDVLSALWLSANMDTSRRIYATYHGNLIEPLTSYGMLYSVPNPRDKVPTLDLDTSAISDGDYIYLRYVNVVDRLGTSFNNVELRYGTFDVKELAPLLDKENKLYSNGSSEIYQ